MKNLPQPTSGFTPQIIAQLFGTENTVCLTPRPITGDMTPLQKNAWRILWERWELAALALINLRTMEATRENERQIDRLLRKFPNLETVIPPSVFEEEYTHDEFVEWH